MARRKRTAAQARVYRRRYNKRLMTRDPGYFRRSALRQLAKRAALLREWKSAPCLDCGGSFPPECMDFDHVRGKKLFCIGFGVGRGYGHERIVAEIAKCDLVCANCHRIRTTRRKRGNSKRKG